MESIKMFWQWIRENEQALRNLRNEKPEIQKMYIYWLNRHLHNYCEHLESILMYPVNENEPTQLVISASGNPQYFDQVITLIENAPKLQAWKLIAFVQPLQNIEELEAGLDKPYVFKDIELKASELKFLPFKYEGIKKIDMVVYLKNFTIHCTNKNLLHVVFIIMQDIIGEKYLFDNISFVELAPMITAESNELIYLYDLQLYLDKLNKNNASKRF